MAKRRAKVYASSLKTDTMVSLESASDFLELMGENRIYRDKETQSFFIILDGVAHSFHAPGMQLSQLVSLNEMGVENMKPLKFKDWTKNDPEDLAKKEWKKKSKVLEEKRGAKTGSAAWLIRSDFKSHAQMEEAAELGYLTMMHMQHGKRGKFRDGPSYYFARECGMKRQSEVNKALSMGLDNGNVVRAIIRGRFKTVDDYNTAKKLRLKTNTELQNFNESGCRTVKEYRDLKKSGWSDREEMVEAGKIWGFKTTESSLYILLLGGDSDFGMYSLALRKRAEEYVKHGGKVPQVPPNWPGYEAPTEIYDRYHETKRTGNKILRLFRDKKNIELVTLQCRMRLSHLWHAKLIHVLDELKPGDTCILAILSAEARKVQDPFNEKPLIRDIVAWLESDVHVQTLGSYNTPDKAFMRDKNDFKKNDFRKKG